MYHFVDIVIGNSKPVIEKESRITFKTVGVVNLLAFWNYFETFDDETLMLVGIKPTRLFGNMVIEHIRQGNQGICTIDPNSNSKQSTAHN